MDIQKEKIAHEKHMLSQGVDFKYLPNIKYSELENVYELIEWDEEYSEALNEINSSWCTWQAAKDQAVPEDTTEELQSTANFMRGMCFDPRLHHDIRGAILDRVSRIDGFLEAQDSCCEP